MLLINKYVNKSFNSCWAKYECWVSTLILLLNYLESNFSIHLYNIIDG